MAWFTRLPRQRAGKPITARSLNQVAEAAEWASRLKAEAPLSIFTTAWGPMLRYLGQVYEAYIAVATTTITARSGSTPGSGTVKYETWNGTALADLPGPVTVTVKSLAAGQIATGSYVIILKIAGTFWVIQGAPTHAWCQLGGTLAAASGAWPSITPTSTTATAYTSSGGSLTSIGTVTIYNYRNVSWSASKTTLILPNPDGTWDIADQDC